MSIQELQATLREHAAAVSDDGLAGRAAASLRRARTTRRRQALAVVAAAVVLGPVVVAAVLANPLDRSAPVVHEPEPTPSVRAAFAGRALLDSEVAQDGGEVTLTRSASAPAQWTVTCHGVGADYTVHATLDGGASGEAPCETLEPPEAQFGYVVDRRYPSGPHTLRVWLTRTGSADVASVDGAVLTAAVYQLPDPVAVVAGADIYPREFAYGTEWQFVASRQSEPGERRVVAAHDLDTRFLGQLVSTGVPTQDVRLFVDGVESDASEVLDGSGYLPVLPAGRHTVELRVRGDVPKTAHLGVVWREATS